MKILILGDIHGHTEWKDYIESQEPDLTIFLGDYVASFSVNSQGQIENLENLLRYKEENSDKIILLRGNHDIQHLMGNVGSFGCSGFFPEVSSYCQSNYERIMKNTQWVYVLKDILDEPIVFSHAGITDQWFEDSGCKTVEDLNNLPPSELFGFRPDSIWDMYGESVTQGCTWVRPQTLASRPINGYTQVVGHTGVKKITDIYKSVKDNQHIWLCDRLPYQCLLLEDGEFKVVDLKATTDDA